MFYTPQLTTMVVRLMHSAELYLQFRFNQIFDSWQSEWERKRDLEDALFRAAHPLTSRYDFSRVEYPELPPYDKRYENGFDWWDDDVQIQVWYASGWIWLYDTEWGSRIVEEDAASIVRLQNIFGCANVAYGPCMNIKENGMYRPGMWVRPVQNQTRRHRESLCYCKSAPYETGAIYQEEQDA